MLRSLVENPRYSAQRKVFSEQYSGFFDVEALLQFSIGKHAEFWPLVGTNSALRVMTTESMIDGDDGFVTIPRFRIAFVIRDEKTVELMAIGVIPDDE